MEQGFLGFPRVINSVVQVSSNDDLPSVGDAATLYINNTTAIGYYYNIGLGSYVALSTDLSAYLPLAGGTMSGAVNFIKATAASASTTNIGAANGNYLNITGNTTINAFDNVQEGVTRILKFDDTLTITYNAVTMILPTADDILTTPGDTAEFVSEGGGAWRCVNYHPQANDFRGTSNATVGNTVTETTLIPATGFGTATIPATWLTRGRKISVSLWGFITNTGTPTIRIRLKFGSTVLADTTAVTMGTITGTGLWRYEGEITCRTTGGTGTVFAQGEFSYYASTSSKRVAASPSTATVTIDTTTTNLIDVSVQWGTASASNTLSTTNCYIQLI